MFFLGRDLVFFPRKIHGFSQVFPGKIACPKPGADLSYANLPGAELVGSHVTDRGGGGALKGDT